MVNGGKGGRKACTKNKGSHQVTKVEGSKKREELGIAIAGSKVGI